MLHISQTKKFICLAKVEQQATISIYVRKLKNGLINILYVGGGIVHEMQSASLLAPRMVSSLLGVDYQEVEKALAGVA